jgi:hypothetical protein
MEGTALRDAVRRCLGEEDDLLLLREDGQLTPVAKNPVFRVILNPDGVEFAEPVL